MPYTPFSYLQDSLPSTLHVKEPLLPSPADRAELADRMTGIFHIFIIFLRTKRPPLNVEMDGMLARLQSAIAEYPSRIHQSEINGMNTGNSFYLLDALSNNNKNGGNVKRRVRRKRRNKANQKAMELIFDEFISLLSAIRLYLNDKNKDDILRTCYDLYQSANSKSGNISDNILSPLNKNPPEVSFADKETKVVQVQQPTGSILANSITDPLDIVINDTINGPIGNNSLSVSIPPPPPSIMSNNSNTTSNTVPILEDEVLNTPDIIKSNNINTSSVVNSPNIKGYSESDYFSQKRVPQDISFHKRLAHKRYMSHFNFGSRNNSMDFTNNTSSLPQSAVNTPYFNFPDTPSSSSIGNKGIVGNTWQTFIKKKNSFMAGSALKNQVSLYNLATGNVSNNATNSLVVRALENATKLSNSVDDYEIQLYLIKCISEMELDKLPKHSLFFCGINCCRMMVSSKDFRYVASRAIKHVRYSVTSVYKEINNEVRSRKNSVNASNRSINSSKEHNNHSTVSKSKSINNLLTINDKLPKNGIVSSIERFDPTNGNVTLLSDHLSSSSNIDFEKKNISIINNDVNQDERDEYKEEFSDPEGDFNSNSNDSIVQVDEFFDAEQDLNKDKGTNILNKKSKINSSPIKSLPRNNKNIDNNLIIEEENEEEQDSINDLKSNKNVESIKKLNKKESIPEINKLKMKNHKLDFNNDSDLQKPLSSTDFNKSNNANDNNSLSIGNSNRASAHRRGISHSGVISQSESVNSFSSLNRPPIPQSPSQQPTQQNSNKSLFNKQKHFRKRSIFENINRFIPGWGNSNNNNNHSTSNNNDITHSRSSSLGSNEVLSTPSADFNIMEHIKASSNLYGDDSITSKQSNITNTNVNANNIFNNGDNTNFTPSINVEGIKPSNSFASGLSSLNQQDMRLEMALKDLQQDPRYIETMGSILSFIYQIWLLRFNSVVLSYARRSITRLNSLNSVDALDSEQTASEKLNKAFATNENDSFAPFYKLLRILAERVSNQNLDPLLDAWSRVRRKDVPILIASLRIIFLGEDFEEGANNNNPSTNQNKTNNSDINKNENSFYASSINSRTTNNNSNKNYNSSVRGNNNNNNIDVILEEDSDAYFKHLSTALERVRELLNDKDNVDLLKELIKAILGFWNDPLIERIRKHINQLHVLAPFKAVLRLFRDFTTVFLPQVIESYRFLSIPVEPIYVGGVLIEIQNEVVIALENVLPGDVAVSGRWRDPRMGGDGAGLELNLSGIHVKFDDLKINVKSSYLNWNGFFACLIGGEGININIRLRCVKIESYKYKAQIINSPSVGDVSLSSKKSKNKSKRKFKFKSRKDGSFRASKSNIDSYIDNDDDAVSVMTDITSPLATTLPNPSIQSISRDKTTSKYATSPNDLNLSSSNENYNPLDNDENLDNSSFNKHRERLLSDNSLVSTSSNRKNKHKSTKSHKNKKHQQKSITSFKSRNSIDDRSTITTTDKVKFNNVKKERWIVKVKCKIPRSCMSIKLSGALGYFLKFYAESKIRTGVEKEIENRVLKICKTFGIYEDKSED